MANKESSSRAYMRGFEAGYRCGYDAGYERATIVAKETLDKRLKKLGEEINGTSK